MSASQSASGEPWSQDPAGQPTKQRLDNTIKIVGAVVGVLTVLIAAITLFLTFRPKDDLTPAYQREAVDTCKRVLALVNDQSAGNGAWRGDGTFDVPLFIKIGREQAAREKAVFDEFFARKVPTSLVDKRAESKRRVEEWYRYSMKTFLPQLQQALPPAVTLQELNVATISLRPGYTKVATPVNRAMTDLAGEPCTALQV